MFVEGESESNQLTERNSGFAAAATKVQKSTHGDGERKRKVEIKGQRTNGLMQDFSVFYNTVRGLDTGSFVPFFYLVEN